MKSFLHPSSNGVTNVADTFCKQDPQALADEGDGWGEKISPYKTLNRNNASILLPSLSRESTRKAIPDNLLPKRRVLMPNYPKVMRSYRRGDFDAADKEFGKLPEKYEGVALFDVGDSEAQEQLAKQLGLNQ
ncbi:hypothetical protein Trydic_g3833 [Trypoxylus dichotomus]